MPSVFNHLIHPCTYTAENGEIRFLTPKDISRVKNYVLAALMLGVAESLYSSRSLKACAIIIVVSAGVVFYIATAILKMLDRGERSIDPRNIDDTRSRAPQPRRSELPKENPRPARNPGSDEQPPSMEGDRIKDPAQAQQERERKLREQDETLLRLTKEMEEMAGRRTSIETRISSSPTTPVHRELPHQPAPQRDPPSRQVPPSAQTAESTMSEIVSRVSTAIFGEENFNIKPAWIDQGGFGVYTPQRNYFASLWDSMYGTGNSLFHSLTHSAEDTDLRTGKYKLMENAPWTSFAKHAQKKLQEEWNKKSTLGKTVSSLLS